MKNLKIFWALLVIFILSAFAVAEPWSAAYLNFEWQIVTAFLKGLLLVEAIGYLYHRFFEHLGFLTQTSKQIRKNQQYHWKHHMIDYPIGTRYVRDEKYQRSQKGIPWEWAFPFFVTYSLMIYFYGITPANIVFMLAVAFDGYLFALVHGRFHVKNSLFRKSTQTSPLGSKHQFWHNDAFIRYDCWNLYEP